MKYFDVHTHLNMQFDNDWLEVGKRTLEAGVGFVNVGADEKSSRLALEQVKELGENAYATVGIHPTENQDDGGLASIRELTKDDKVVAIGECGLEYFRLKDKAGKPAFAEATAGKQKELFIKHIELALEVNKPLMIHCRDAYDDLYEILKSYKDKVGDKLKFNLHFFTSDWPIAKKFLDLGGYLSFPGVITFTNQYDEIVKNMPLDRIMSETDAPFATPKPFRGKRNEPLYVQYVAEHIANLRPEPKEEVLTALVENAMKFYNLN